jgi:hypothetical protein
MIAPGAERDTVVFVVEVGEAVVGEEVSVPTASVAVEELFALLDVPVGGDDEVSVLLLGFVPPVESDFV